MNEIYDYTYMQLVLDDGHLLALTFRAELFADCRIADRYDGCAAQSVGRLLHYANASRREALEGGAQCLAGIGEDALVDALGRHVARPIEMIVARYAIVGEDNKAVVDAIQAALLANVADQHARIGH